MALIIFCVLVVLAALTGARFKPGEWYRSLEKPSWTPPNWAFPVVWSILYIFIAIAGWLIWRKVGWGPVPVVWGIGLVLNAAWSWLFFGRKRMDLAFADICLLWLSIAVFIVMAWPISVWASLLFVPYLGWVSTAALLNWTIWELNTNTVPS